MDDAIILRARDIDDVALTATEMLLSGKDALSRALHAQLKTARISRIEIDAGGFYVDFEVDQRLRVIDPPIVYWPVSDVPIRSTEGEDAIGRLVGRGSSSEGAATVGFVLFIKNGLVTTLDAHLMEGRMWPTGMVSLRYEHVGGGGPAGLFARSLPDPSFVGPKGEDVIVARDATGLASEGDKEEDPPAVSPFPSNMQVRVTGIDGFHDGEYLLWQDDLMANVVLDACSENGWMSNRVWTTTHELRKLAKAFIEHARASTKPCAGRLDLHGIGPLALGTATIEIPFVERADALLILIGMQLSDDPASDERCQICVRVDPASLERFGKELLLGANRKKEFVASLNDYMPFDAGKRPCIE